MADPFIGEIKVVAFGFPPRGWARCDGQILPIAQNQPLFSLLGTTYGGNGVTTFALPDLRGRAAMQFGQRPGGSSYSLGQVGGQAAVGLSINQLPAHTHQAMANGAAGAANNPQANVWAASAQADNQYAASGDTTMNPGAIGQAGQGQAHPNMQPSLSLMFIIALVGIYPPRN